MPEILGNDSLLYAQAFAAVNHINFMNPKAYKPERYALKEHAIQKINRKLNDPESAASDASIGAVLCLASAAQLEVSSSIYAVGFIQVFGIRTTKYPRDSISCVSRINCSIFP